MPMRKPRPEYLIALIGVVIAIAWIPLRMKFPFDDTYITFRYAQNLAHGFGIVWNPASTTMRGGPHTEGYTNFLYMLLLVPFSALGLDLVAVAQCINVIAVIVSAVAIYQIGYRMSNSKEPLYPTPYALNPGVFVVALFYLDPFTWFNAFSGLETSLFTMWLLLSLRVVPDLQVRSRTTPDLKVRCYTSFIFAMLATLTRPEGALIGGILLFVCIFNDRENWQATAKAFLIAFAAPLVIYAAWKLYYFGNLLPNSFYVKVAQTTTILPGRGTMRIFYEGIWYLPLLAIFAFKRWRHNAAVQCAALWCILLTAFYLFSQLVQPQYERFTNSIEAMLIVLVGFAGYRVWGIGYSKKEQSNPYTLNPMSYTLAALLAFHIVWALTFRGGLSYITADTTYNDRYRQMAEVFRSIPHHEDITLAWADAGILPYYSGLRFLDVVGLNYTPIAHAKTPDEVVRLIAEAKPDIIFIPLEPGTDSIVRWGHGLIGQAYPKLLRQPEMQSYKPIARIPQSVYDLDVYVDTLSPHYRDIIRGMPDAAHTPSTLRHTEQAQ
jgi:arabinofuranosyltransferase